MIKFLLFILFNIFIITPCYGFIFGPSPNHPERKWYVIETEHFLIHYYNDNELMAKNLANIADSIYKRITKDFDIEIKQKVPVIISEDEFFNGSAEAFKNRIILEPFIARTSYIGLERYFAHEFTHVATYEALNNQGIMLNKITNIMSVPVWFFEGIAQYEAEYWYPSYDRMLCLHTLQNSLLTLQERNVFSFLGDSYASTSGYNEGYNFIKYLFNTYGHNKLTEIFSNIRKYSYLTFEEIINLTFNKSLPDLENKWIKYLKKEYELKTKDKVQFLPNSITVIPRIKQEVNTKLKLSYNEELQAYLSSKNSNTFTMFRGYLVGMLPLIVSNLDNSNSITINDKVIDFAWAPDSYQIAYTYLKASSKGLITTDIGLISLEKKGNKVILKEKTNFNLDYLKPLYLTWSNDGKYLISTTVEQEKSNIVLIDIKERKKVKNIITSNDNKQYKDLSLLDQDNILCVSYYPGEGGSINLINLSSGNQTQLTDYAILYGYYNPIYEPNDNYVYFSSDKDGFLNLYRININTSKLEKLTNTYTGVETPFISKNGKTLYYTQFYDKGTEIRKWELPENIEKEDIEISLDSCFRRNDNVEIVNPFNFPTYLQNDLSNISLNNYKINQEYPIKEYTIDFSPEIIIPIIGADERGDQIGIQGIFSDLLETNVLGFKFLYGLNSYRPTFILNYTNYNFHPILSLKLYSYPDLAITTDGEVPYYEQITGTGLEISSPIFNKLAIDKENLLLNGTVGSLELEFNKQSLLHSFGVNSDKFREGLNNSISFSLSNDSSSGNLKNFHPEAGYKWLLKIAHSSSLLASNFNYNQLFLDTRYYYPVIKDKKHVFAFNLILGANFGDVTPLLLGGTPLSSSLNYQELIPLRGFSFAEFLGDRLFKFSFEYRLPLIENINLNISSLYFNKLYWTLFTDSGDAWFSNQRLPYLFSSIGTELKLRTIVFNKSPLNFYIGTALPLSWEKFIPKFYFGIANIF